MFVLFGAYYGLSPRAHSLPVGPRIGPKPNYLVGWVGPWALWALRRSTCEGSPTFQEEYGGSYIPKVIKTEFGLQVVAPDTPYVAVAGPDKLLFIDNWFEIETAKRMKEHIEKATVPNPDEYIAIDEVLATAEVKNHVTGETAFVFDPVYARMLFAKGMNRHNPDVVTRTSNCLSLSPLASGW